MSFARIEARLTDVIGVDPAAISRAGLQRAVERRMEAVGTSSLEAYARRIRRDPEEFDRLAAAALVHETSFFRYPASFALLADEARRYAQSAPGQRFRVHCVACATGEEPASVVIALLEAGLDPKRAQVDASDVSAHALEYASRGQYRERTMRAVSPARRTRYFRRIGDGWRLDPDIVRRIRYRRTNVIEPSFGRNDGVYDAVFCRNLLIYLVPDARQRLLDALLGMLAPGGLLLVGHAEVAAVRARGLPLAAPPDAFACRHEQGPPAVDERVHATAATLEPQPVAPPDVGEAGVPAPRDPLEEASRHADAGRLDDARRLLAACTTNGSAGVEHFHLLALVESAAGDDDASEQALSKALYLDPVHEPSLVQMALLAEARGEDARARRLKEKARRVRAESIPEAETEDEHGDV